MVMVMIIVNVSVNVNVCDGVSVGFFSDLRHLICTGVRLARSYLYILLAIPSSFAVQFPFYV